MNSLSWDAGSSGGFGSGGSSGGNTTVGEKEEHSGPSGEDMVRVIVGRMRELSLSWSERNDEGRNDELHRQASQLASQLAQYGVGVEYLPASGAWKITSDKLHPENAGKYLYDCYHTGGFVGGAPLRPNERYIKAERGELVLTANQQDSLVAQIDRIRAITDAFRGAVLAMPNYAGLVGGLSRTAGTVNNVTNTSKPVNITMGDVVIRGSADAETVRQHRRAAQEQVNLLARTLGVKW